MAAIVLELGLSNMAVAGATRAPDAGCGTMGPTASAHPWSRLLVLLKLVTPPVLDLPVRLLPAEPAAVSQIAKTSSTADETPTPFTAPNVDATMPATQDAQDAVAEPQAKVIGKNPQTFGELKMAPVPSIAVAADSLHETAASFGSTASSFNTSLIPLGPAETISETVSATIPIPAAKVEPPTSQPPCFSVGRSDCRCLAVWGHRVACADDWAYPPIHPNPFAGERCSRLVDVRSSGDGRQTRPEFPTAREVDSGCCSADGLVARPHGCLFPSGTDRSSLTVATGLTCCTTGAPKRGDHWVRWLELVAISLYWWCPLAWFARRELQRAEEECCDAWVVATLPAEGHTYATALLDTLDFLAGAPHAPALASGMSSAAAIKRRLLLILDGRTPKRLSRVGRWMIVFAALLLLPIAPKLARLAGAVPAEDARVEEPKQAKAPADVEAGATPVLKAANSVDSANPRGEPLLFDPKFLDIRPGSTNWWSVSVSPDGKQIATSQGDTEGKKGEVKIWERSTGKITNVIQEPKGVRAVAFSPDGKMLATGNYDGKLRFYETATFTLCASGEGHKSGINGVCFFKNGKYLATAGLDNTARIWNIASIPAKAKTGDPVTVPSVAVFEGHTQGLLSVSVSADGRTLLTGSLDKTARCYDVPEPLPAPGEAPAQVKKERLLLQGHNAAVEAVAVSPDGLQLATASWDSRVLIRDRRASR